MAVELEAVSDGTEVRITHGYTFDDEREGYVEGWLHFLGKLREIL